MEIIKLKPVFKQMIWGGDKLRTVFKYDVEGSNIGECWGISAHPNGDCTIASGEYEGKSLSWLYDNHRELFGGIDDRMFPLLTKIIDAKTDLSIQVHPDDDYAFKNEDGSLGKTECWYVLDAEPGATIVIGHNAATHEEVEDMITNKRWNDFIREIPVKAGDFFQINPGTVHAIKGGTLILETQQNSDITYRVYDYDRLTDGKPRPLHVSKSIDVINAPFVDEAAKINTDVTVNTNMHQLVSCPFYTVWKLDVDNEEQVVMDQKFMLVSVIEGEGTVKDTPIKMGDHFIVPADVKNINFSGAMKMIVSAPA